jgi:hypothetical protein
MSQHLQRKYVKRYKIRVLEEGRQIARQNGGPLSGAERAGRWRERCKPAARGVDVSASTSTAEPVVPTDVHDMDSIDDVVSSSQESGSTKITGVTDDTSGDTSAGAGVSAEHRATVRAGGRLRTLLRTDRTFPDSTFGHACGVCDCPWFETDLKKTIDKHFEFLRRHFPDEDVTAFELCAACRKDINNGKLPTLSNSSK